MRGTRWIEGGLKEGIKGGIEGDMESRIEGRIEQERYRRSIQGGKDGEKKVG